MPLKHRLTDVARSPGAASLLCEPLKSELHKWHASAAAEGGLGIFVAARVARDGWANLPRYVLACGVYLCARVFARAWVSVNAFGSHKFVSKPPHAWMCPDALILYT